MKTKRIYEKYEHHAESIRGLFEDVQRQNWPWLMMDLFADFRIVIADRLLAANDIRRLSKLIDNLSDELEQEMNRTNLVSHQSDESDE